ncbi:MAG: TPM domain-containing protein [Acidobacteria bacterium]|jgi:uncharacterized protein|nr:TPM domain-containing protein [Acidobacteriota bacterium]
MNLNRNLLKLNALRLVLLLCLTVFAAPAFLRAQSDKPFSINESPLPAPTGFVNDYAGVLDEATKQQIEARIKAFSEKWNPPIELGVAIVKTTAERPIFEYSLAVARGWKIGSKEDDNPSALLMIAVDDRQYFTQVSKDLQDEMPDAVVGQLQRQYLVPAFKQGNYSKGVADTIDAYIRTIEAKQLGQPNAPTPETQPFDGINNRSRGGGMPFGNCMTCLIILFVIMIIIFSRGGRGGGGGFGQRNRWGGGGFGGSALPWIIGSSIINSGGSSGWGGSSSSGDSGGGFGGFGGGGDFDGGGSGGSW